jgi:hypothetical protein
VHSAVWADGNACGTRSKLLPDASNAPTPPPARRPGPVCGIGDGGEGKSAGCNADLAHGLSNRAIAARLGISEKIAEHH